MADKHTAWCQLIIDYPDMPTPKNMHYESFDSLHQKLAELVDYEERLLALFKKPEPNVVYMYEVGEYRRSDSVFTSFDKLRADLLENYDRDEAPQIKVTKIRADDKGEIRVFLDYDGIIRRISIFGDGGEWLPHDTDAHPIRSTSIFHYHSNAEIFSQSVVYVIVAMNRYLSLEYSAARATTVNAFYTSPTVIKAIYETVERMGFSKGNMLEPSMGIGNFFGLLPESMKEAKRYGVELDGISGRIAKQLYQNAEIEIKGFEETNFRENFFDLAIGNVPFGNYKVFDPKYEAKKFNIHDYFFAKSLDGRPRCIRDEQRDARQGQSIHPQIPRRARGAARSSSAAE